MNVVQLDDLASPLAVVDAPPFRPEEWRTSSFATGAPDRRSDQRHQSAAS